MLRKKETEDVVDMLNDRVEAEMAYAARLERISSERYSQSFQIGTLAEEVENFRYSC